MGKYTADDNRSMQLNDNNERYYSSRGIADDDDYDDEDYSCVGYSQPTRLSSGPTWKAQCFSELKEEYRLAQSLIDDETKKEEYRQTYNSYRRKKRAWIKVHGRESFDQLDHAY